MKHIALILLLALLISLFSGCVNSPAPNSSSDDESSAYSQAISSTSMAEESDSQTDILPQGAEETGTENLYTLDIPVKSAAEMVECDYANGYILFKYINPGMDSSDITIAIYSISENSIKATQTYSATTGDFGMLNSGGYCYLDNDNTRAYIYDSNGDTAQIIDVENDGLAWSRSAITRDGKFIMYVQMSDGGTMLYNTETKQINSIESHSIVAQILDTDETSFFVKTQNGEIIKVIPSTKCEEVLQTPAVTVCGNSKVLIGEANEYTYVYPNYQSDKGVMSSTLQFQYVMEATEKYIINKTFEDVGLRIYSYTENKSKGLVLPEQNILCCTTVRDELLLVITQNDKNEKNYYICDLRNTSEWTKTDFVPAEQESLVINTIPEWNASDEYIVKAESILEKYGVRIFFSKESIDMETFCVKTNYITEERASKYLDYCVQLFDALPEGLVKAINGDEEVWMFLCDDIDMIDLGAFGYATYYCGRSIIVMDAGLNSPVFKEVLAHEFSHVIDHQADIEYLDSWTNLMPKKVSDTYAYSYFSPAKNEYTPYDNDKTEVWFVSFYCKTFPGEDRADTFKEMYSSVLEGKLTYEINHEHTLEKARLYVSMLLERFSTCSQAITEWAKVFNDK